MWKGRLVFPILGIALLLPTAVSSGKTLTEISAVFTFGDSCDLLANLSRKEIIELLNSKNQDEWETFCTVGEEVSCADYSYIVSKYGYLEKTKDFENMCKFEQYRIHDPGPDIFRNYWYLPIDGFGQQIQNEDSEMESNPLEWDENNGHTLEHKHSDMHHHIEGKGA